MTWIRTIAEPEATGELAEAYAHIEQLNGSVSNITRVSVGTTLRDLPPTTAGSQATTRTKPANQR